MAPVKTKLGATTATTDQVNGHIPNHFQPSPSQPTHPSPFTITPYTLQSSTPTPVYTIRPTAIWESLERHRHCIVQTPTAPIQFTLNSDIHLHRPSHADIWTARILEIRAHDAQHAYLRVYYYYHPSQLPVGVKQSYGDVIGAMGEGEVVASNEMEVVRADGVLGVADVTHLGEGDREGENGALMWRYTYDVITGKVEYRPASIGS